MSRREYPKEKSQVKVTFVDETVKTYIMTAGHGIAGYLMHEAARTGVLLMRDDETKRSTCIPMGQIRHVEISPYDPNAVTES